MVDKLHAPEVAAIVLKWFRITHNNIISTIILRMNFVNIVMTYYNGGIRSPRINGIST